jgi:copper resistance protein B
MKNLALVILTIALAQTVFAAQQDEVHSEHDMYSGHASDTSHTMGGIEDMDSDPWLNYLHVEQFEWRDADNAGATAWNVSAWSGKSVDKLWLNTEGERLSGHTKRAETQLLYSRAISSYWDIQTGVRSDIDPQPSQHWATFGVRGLAPYFFDIDAQLFVADHGRTAARAAAEYELMLTQKLTLTPKFEINAYGKDDIERGIGSGFSSLEAALRLRYEIVREFAPYIGVTHEHKLGDTANMARDADEERSETMLVIGISAWL